mmetsp:Transcript_8780/g.17936  ORF Transcript_8780/g.17936 Transcript_8780/m.17936 type:complete len:607 (-) Transcript_8780:3125-4945(-)
MKKFENLISINRICRSWLVVPVRRTRPLPSPPFVQVIMQSGRISITYLLHVLAIPFLAVFFSSPANSQYYEGSPQYEQKAVLSKENLINDLHSRIHDSPPSHPMTWRTAYPPRADYTIGLLVNPCGANGTYSGVGGKALGYDCCINNFGRGEYGLIRDQEHSPVGEEPLIRGLQASPWHELTGPDEVLHNMQLVDEDWVPIPQEHSRRADDVTMIDDDCVGYRNPYPYCLDNRLKAIKSNLMPPCTDNNQTVDATLDCYTPDGRRMPHCMQIAYTQTALIHICGGDFANDPRCGTFIEIHRPNGSPYNEETSVLSETKITTRIADGMITTTIPLTYRGDPNKIMCNYHETRIRVGSMVKITADAAVCCCPPKYREKQGSFLCPRRPQGDGPLAIEPKTLKERLEVERYESTYPLCHGDDHKDVVMCSKRASGSFSAHGAYTYPCAEATLGEDGLYGSDDLAGRYEDSCPIGDAFIACAMMPTGEENCLVADHRMTLRGEIGKVMAIDEAKNNNQNTLYQVSFNDGRTSYSFVEDELDLIHLDNTYELWFVQRDSSDNAIKKRKPFIVLWPPCSFDSVNDRYFPYAQLDEGGQPMPAVAEYDGIMEE